MCTFGSANSSSQAGSWGSTCTNAPFPAVMLSTMYLLTRVQGADFARATGKAMLPASANIVVYSVSVSIIYPIVGLATGP